eukprot:127666_1
MNHLTSDNKITSNEFNHLLYDRNGMHMNKIIAINIDIEAVNSSEYSNNYNRKFLGPLQPVKSPLVIDVISDSIGSVMAYDSDEESNDWHLNKPIKIRETKSLNETLIASKTEKLNRKHKRSASISVFLTPTKPPKKK